LGGAMWRQLEAIAAATATAMKRGAKALLPRTLALELSNICITGQNRVYMRVVGTHLAVWV
jgi:hypothetical protein